MKRRDFIVLSALASGISSVSPVWAQFNLGRALDAGRGLAQAQSISDEELKAAFDQIAARTDQQHRIAAPNDPYGQRLATLSRGLNRYDGLDLDIKAYIKPEINAFAMANGTIRIFSGLMDQFTDDEVLYVIGHVQAGHTRARLQAAMRTDALRNGVAASGDRAARIADSELGELFQQVILAHHSQGNENEADDYAMRFMKANNYDTRACATALDKLDALSGGAGASWLSTHPSPRARATRMREQQA